MVLPSDFSWFEYFKFNICFVNLLQIFFFKALNSNYFGPVVFKPVFYLFFDYVESVGRRSHISIAQRDFPAGVIIIIF